MALRGGKRTPLKSNTDAALLHCSDRVRCLVVKHTGDQIHWTEGRDVDVQALMDTAAPDCPPRPMGAEDPLFILYTVAIWICYFLQFYVSFFCFGFSADLSIMAALVMFVVGSIAVVVPTPNGAGPWHFAVITMMMLYGVGKEDAGIFALLVHGIQTFLLILLGIYGLAALPFTNKTKKL